MTEACAIDARLSPEMEEGRSLEQDGEGDRESARTDEQEHAGTLNSGQMKF